MITKVLLKNQITNSILKTLIKDTVPYFHRETFQSLVDATLFFRKPSSWLLIVSNEYFYKLEDKTVSMNTSSISLSPYNLNVRDLLNLKFFCIKSVFTLTLQKS